MTNSRKKRKLSPINIIFGTVFQTKPVWRWFIAYSLYMPMNYALAMLVVYTVSPNLLLKWIKILDLNYASIPVSIFYHNLIIGLFLLLASCVIFLTGLVVNRSILDLEAAYNEMSRKVLIVINVISPLLIIISIMSLIRGFSEQDIYIHSQRHIYVTNIAYAGIYCTIDMLFRSNTAFLLSRLWRRKYKNQPN